MKVNTNQIKESCIEHECPDCNVKLLIFNKDIKSKTINKKGEEFISYDSNHISHKDVNYKDVISTRLIIWYDVYYTFDKDIKETYFKCLACKNNVTLNIDGNNKWKFYSNKENYGTEFKREIDNYKLSGYYGDIFELTFNTYSPEIEITKEQYDKMKSWKPKRLINYLIDNYKEEEEE